VHVTSGGPAWFHPGRSATIRQGPKVVIGWFGELHPAILDLLGAEGPLAGFELILEAIPAPRARPTRTKPPLVLSDLQPVRRDFAFLLDRVVESGKVVRAAEAADRKLIKAVSVFDLFESDTLGPDKKSLAIEVTLQPTDRTLTDEEIDAVGKKVVAEVTKATGGMLRG
jgi:phenylalanyl-tRNA synthetase beta chain